MTVPEPDSPAFREWKKHLDKLKAENRKTLLGLRSRGLVIEESSILNSRMESLVDSIAEAMGPAGPEFQLMAQVRWQEKLGTLLGEMEQKSTGAIIASASTFTPGQISSLARETGTPGWGSLR